MSRKHRRTTDHDVEHLGVVPRAPAKAVKWVLYSLLSLAGVVIFGILFVLYVLHIYSVDLPDYRQLANYKPPVVTRLYAQDGKLIGQYAIEKRVFVPFEFIPKQLVKAVIAAEDQNFYKHQGVDFAGIMRAMVQNVDRFRNNQRMVGASTITQQVAKNFLLTTDRTLQRKIKEAILAIRIERTLSKDQILELYLNEIYMGYGAYGVAAAALNYFDKSLNELTLPEMAYLAALPKAPNNYHPTQRMDAAIARRNWVLERMREENFITREEKKKAQEAALSVRPPRAIDSATADYFAEDVRRFLQESLGTDALYRGGLTVRTTVRTDYQVMLERALQNGLVSYDRRMGWRGPVQRLALKDGWQQQLRELVVPGLPTGWMVAVVRASDAQSAQLTLADGRGITLTLNDVRWARAALKDGYVGAAVSSVSQVLKAGDVVVVERIVKDEGGQAVASYQLRQMPKVDGAAIAMDPHTGRVLAMAGGFSYGRSQFNRATQAKRQPGSAFKPIVYMAGLQHGFTPATQILDAPIVVEQGPGLPRWKPDNYTKRFYGAVPMRVGIEQSRNLMTVRLAQAVGMEHVVELAKKLNVVDDMPPLLAAALGSTETTLIRLTSAYAMIANGGKEITPVLIDRIQDRYGLTIYRADTRTCDGCNGVAWQGQSVPVLADDRDQVIDPVTAYQMTSMLEGVVQRGTARRIQFLNRPLAGKTGTTNKSQDAWFIGFTPDLVVGVFVGFDEPASLGKRETAANIATPIFADFMSQAMIDEPVIPFRIPAGVRLVPITLPSADASMDEVVEEATEESDDPNAANIRPRPTGPTILEAFREGTEPKPGQQMMIGNDPRAGVAEDTGLEGVY